MMRAVNLRVPLNADLRLSFDISTQGLTEAAFAIRQPDNTSITGTLAGGKVTVVGQGEVEVRIPRADLGALSAGVGDYDFIVKRGGVVDTIQFGQVVVVDGVATLN